MTTVSHRVLTRNILSILATALVLFAGSFLISCSGTENEAEGAIEASYPDSPAGVVEDFYKSFGNGECERATQYLLLGGSREIEVFISNTASPADIQRMDTEIRGMPEVESVKYVSKEEALERLRESLKGHEDLLNNVYGNPLPASFEITVRDPLDTETVASRFFDDPAVDNTPGRHDGVLYRRSESVSEYMNFIKDFCDQANSRGYEISELKIISSSINDSGEANVKLEVTATMDGTGSEPGELSLTLVNLDGNWKIDADESPGLLGLMLINIKESRGSNDTQAHGNNWDDAGIEIVTPPSP